MRQQREPDVPKKITKTVSMSQELSDAISARAELEGHRNWSAVVVAAVREYFGKAFTPKEATDDRAA